MSGALEACTLHGGAALPAAMIAPGEDGKADLYWRRRQDSPVVAGQAIDARGQAWLVEDVAVWRGRPGGVHLQLRRCNAAGTLTPRTATKYGYGMQLVDGTPINIIGAINVFSTEDSDGNVDTRAELVPAGSWPGKSGDLVTLTDTTRWEQVGDVMDRASGSWTPLPVLRLRRARA